MSLHIFNSELCGDIRNILECMGVQIASPIYTLPDGEIHAEGRIVPTLDVKGCGHFSSVEDIGNYLKSLLPVDLKTKSQTPHEYISLHKDVGVLNIHVDGKLEKIVLRRDSV